MAVLLYAWDYGANRGHAVRDVVFNRSYNGSAKAYFVLQAGSESLYTRCSPKRLVLAPEPTTPPRSLTPESMAEIFWKLEACDVRNLQRRVEAWLDILNKTKPSLVIYNHAPLAAIAAYCLGIPVLPIGTPFELSFFHETMPVFNNKPSIYEAAYLNAIQTVLQNLKAKPIQKTLDLCGLGAQEGLYLTCQPFTDPYASNITCVRNYIGTGLSDYGQPMAWTGNADTKKVFVYVNGKDSIAVKLLNVLNADSWRKLHTRLEVIVYSPGIDPLLQQQLTHLRWSDKPVKLGPLWESMDVLIASGGTTLYKAAEMSVPTIALPTHQEQEIVATQLVTKRLGAMIETSQTGVAIRHTLEMFLTTSDLRDDICQRLQRLNDRYDTTMFNDRRKLVDLFKHLGIKEPVVKSKHVPMDKEWLS